MRSQALDENESKQWKSKDELTETCGPLHDGASRYQNLAPGNGISRNKPEKANYTHCRNRVETRRDARFNYKRDGRYRKPNSSGSKDGREPRRGKEERDQTCGHVCEDEQLCSLTGGNVVQAEEGMKYTVSNLQPEDKGQTNTPTEDLEVGTTVNENLDESKEKQDPSSDAEMNHSPSEKRAENSQPKLEHAGGLLEGANPLVKDDDILQASVHTVKTSEAVWSSPRAEINLQCEDKAVNCDQSQMSSTVDQASTESEHIPSNIPRNPEKSSNSDNETDLLNSGDSKAEEEVEVKTENIGECPQNPNGDLLKELSSCLCEINISIEHPQSDYSTYLLGEPQTYDVDFGHIIEIYDFPPHVKTEDIQEAFASFRDKGFRIKWVDNSHALGIFSSSDAASEALTISHELFKTQPLSQATKQSKLKVSRCSEFLQPVKERAQVNTAIAKRLVSRALGFQTSERKVQPDPKPRNPKENKVPPSQTEDDADSTLNSGSAEI
ncbi:uncharacterized protein LOC144610204 [Rhinoraja longicauda]